GDAWIPKTRVYVEELSLEGVLMDLPSGPGTRITAVSISAAGLFHLTATTRGGSGSLVQEYSPTVYNKGSRQIDEFRLIEFPATGEWTRSSMSLSQTHEISYCSVEEGVEFCRGPFTYLISGGAPELTEPGAPLGFFN